MPITIHTPRQPIESRKNSVNSEAIGQTQAPPMKCTIARMRAADGLGRIFAGVSKGERLLAAEPDAGNEARGDEPPYRRRERTRMVKMPNSSRLKLVDGLAAPSVAELGLGPPRR